MKTPQDDGARLLFLADLNKLITDPVAGSAFSVSAGGYGEVETFTAREFQIVKNCTHIDFLSANGGIVETGKRETCNLVALTETGGREHIVSLDDTLDFEVDGKGFSFTVKEWDYEESGGHETCRTVVRAYRAELC